jgi:hypothetical protein
MAQEPENLETKSSAEVSKGGETGLVSGDGGWNWLLGFAVYEFAKVEGSAPVRMVLSLGGCRVLTL